MTATAAPRHRLVAIGASNLARLALALLDAERSRTGGPVAMHAALGRGRSYGLPSRLLGRGLDSILASPIWAQLPGGDAATTTAVLLDVGNDLLYGAPVPRILDWAHTAVTRLCAHARRVVVVGLPLASIATLSPRRFVLVRRVLIPSCTLSLADAIAGAKRLHDGLEAMARDVGATFHDLPGAWYGFDPVHIRRGHQWAAVRSWLAADAEPQQRLDGSWPRLRLLLAAPATRRWFGHTTTCPQPCRRFTDGSSLSLW